jgi:hypothetical protein
LGAALLAGASLCSAAEVAAPKDSLAAFVERYARALQERDLDGYKRLVHPRSLACADVDQADYYEYLFHQKQWLTARTARASFKIVPESHLTGMVYPVRPTHLLQVNLALGEFKSKTLLVQVAAHEGAWFEVVPCPTPDVLRTLRASAAKERAEVARAEALLSSLRDPLRSELAALLRQGKKVTAIIRYRDVSGEDLSVAKRVIELLERRLE